MCSVALLIFLRVHSEVRRPETIATDREGNESGLRDRSAGFERARKLISLLHRSAFGCPLAAGALPVRLVAEAPVPSLRHERAAPGRGTPAAAGSAMRLPEIDQFAGSHSV